MRPPGPLAATLQIFQTVRFQATLTAKTQAHFSSLSFGPRLNRRVEVALVPGFRLAGSYAEIRRFDVFLDN
jgi:hypothetical protein